MLGAEAIRRVRPFLDLINLDDAATTGFISELNTPEARSNFPLGRTTAQSSNSTLESLKNLASPTNSMKSPSFHCWNHASATDCAWAWAFRDPSRSMLRLAVV